MDLGTHSDPLLNFALYSGLAVFLLTVVLLLMIAILRYTIDRRKRMEQALAERWQPVFIHAVEGMPIEAPRIMGRDRQTILPLWIHFSESIRGEARLRLRQLALDLKLERTALKLLARKNIRSRLLAIVALGRLGVMDAWEQLTRLVADPNPMVSLLAMRSLLQIDAGLALPLMLDELSRRDDWPLKKVADTLGEIPAEVLAAPLLQALHAVSPDNAPRLLSLLETTNLGDTWPVLAPLLGENHPPEVLAAALKACRDPRALAAARSLTTHEQWIVRAQAAATLGRLGIEEDRLRLLSMLSDSEWWVRYRAGMALTSLPFITRQELEELQKGLTDRFAADILAQVLAESALQATA